MTPPRNIIRVDHEASRTHAWRVTVQRHKDIAVKMFSDAIYGGKRNLKGSHLVISHSFGRTFPWARPFRIEFPGALYRVISKEWEKQRGRESFIFSSGAIKVPDPCSLLDVR